MLYFFILILYVLLPTTNQNLSYIYKQKNHDLFMGEESNEEIPQVFYSDSLEYKSVATKEGTKYFIKGHVSTPDLDLVDDIVSNECLDDMNRQAEDHVLKLDFEHEAFLGKTELEMDVAKTKSPLGKCTQTLRDTKGLVMEWEMNPNWVKLDSDNKVVKDFSQAWQEIKGGFLDAFSIAFIPVESETREISGTVVRVLKAIKLLNVALTGNPVNTKARLSDIVTKSLDALESKMVEKKNKETSETQLEKDFKSLQEEMESLKVRLKSFEDEAKKRAESKSLDDEKEKKEKKSLDEALSEVKSLVESVKEENAEIKGILEKPQHTSPAVGAATPNREVAETKSMEPLDMLV